MRDSTNTSDIAEQAKHKRYVELLSQEAMLPIEQIEPLYGEVLSQLKENAEILDFVPVFAWRRTRALLVHR